MNKVGVHATRTNCMTGENKDVEVLLVLEQGQHGNIVAIREGGVTGYESFYLEDWKEGSTWTACAGTPKRWDTLHISASEMKRALDILGKS